MKVRCPQCQIESEPFFECPICGYQLDGQDQHRIAGQKSFGKPIVIILITAAVFFSGLLYKHHTKPHVPLSNTNNYVATDTISNGEPVDLKSHIIPNRYTVFVFYADW